MIVNTLFAAAVSVLPLGDADANVQGNLAIQPQPALQVIPEGSAGDNDDIHTVSLVCSDDDFSNRWTADIDRIFGATRIGGGSGGTISVTTIGGQPIIIEANDTQDRRITAGGITEPFVPASQDTLGVWGNNSSKAFRGGEGFRIDVPDDTNVVTLRIGDVGPDDVGKTLTLSYNSATETGATVSARLPAPSSDGLSVVQFSIPDLKIFALSSSASITLGVVEASGSRTSCAHEGSDDDRTPEPEQPKDDFSIGLG